MMANIPNVRLPCRRATDSRGAVRTTSAKRPSMALNSHILGTKPHLLLHQTKKCNTSALCCELMGETNFLPKRPPLRKSPRQICRVTSTIAPGADDDDDDEDQKKNPSEGPEPEKMRKEDQPKEITGGADGPTGLEMCRKYLSDIGMGEDEIDLMILKHSVTKYMSWDYKHPLAPNKRRSWDPRLCDHPCCSEYPCDMIDEYYRTMSFENTRVILMAQMEPKSRLGQSSGMYMLPLGGASLVDQAIHNLNNAGISSNIYVATQHASYYLNKRLHSCYSYGREGDPAVKVLASNQTKENKDWSVSDLDCLQKNFESIMEDEKSIGLTSAREFVICTGSSVHDVDFRSLLSFHRSRGSDLTVCAVSVPKAQVEACIHMDFSNHLVAYNDTTAESHHSRMGKSLKNTGIFVFNTGALQTLLQIMNGDDADFVAKAFAHNMNVNVYKHSEYWHEIETVKDYYDIVLELLGGQIRKGHHFPVHTDLPSPVFMGTNVLHRSFIGGGTYLSGNCSLENSFIGNNLILGHGVSVSNSVLMHCHNRISDQNAFHEGMTFSSHMFDREDDLFTTVIGDNVVMENCVVDENVHVGPGSIITNVSNVKEGGKDGSFFINEGIVYLLKDCNLPANSVI